MLIKRFTETAVLPRRATEGSAGYDLSADLFQPEVIQPGESKLLPTGIGVAQARGVILMTAAKLGVHIFEYTPSQVKQAVVGYGKAEKRQVMDMTKRILHLSAVPKPDDAADAVAIALCHARSHTSRLTRFGL